MIKYVLAALLSVLLSCLSQVLLKTAGSKTWTNVLREYLNAYVIGGYCLLGLCLLLGLYVMSGIDLKYMAVFESLGYVIMMIVSNRIFGERITRKKWIGIVGIMLGIVVFNIAV